MKKLTKEQAREFLKDKYVITNVLNDRLAEVFYEKSGYILDNDCIGGPFLRRAAGFENLYGFYNQSRPNEYTELPLSELLSIEITEEPDYKAKFEEAVKLLSALLEERDFYRESYMRATDRESDRQEVDELGNKINAFIAANRGV